MPLSWLAYLTNDWRVDGTCLGSMLDDSSLRGFLTKPPLGLLVVCRHCLACGPFVDVGCSHSSLMRPLSPLNVFSHAGDLNEQSKPKHLDLVR